MVDWINISQASGSGNATITVTASTYSELLERTTSLTVRTPSRSAIVTITQRYNSSFIVSPTLINDVPASGGSYTIDVTISGDWYVSRPLEYYDWIDYSYNGSHSGNGSFTLTISANTGTSRTATIGVANSTIYDTPTEWRYITINQVASGQTPESFRFTTGTLSFSPQAQSFPIAVRTEYPWTLTAPAWVTLSAYSGTGDTNITVTVPQNNGADRNGVISGGTSNVTDVVYVSQSGYNNS